MSENAGASAVQEPSSCLSAWYQREAPEGATTSKEALESSALQPETESSRDSPETAADASTSPAEREAEPFAITRVDDP